MTNMIFICPPLLKRTYYGRLYKPAHLILFPNVYLNNSFTYGQFYRDLRDKIRIFSTLRTCSDHISSNKIWIYCPILSIKHCLPSCKTFFVSFTNSEKKERDLRDIFGRKCPVGHAPFSQNL